MPLHDWDHRDGFSGLHHGWITELLRHIKPNLPEGFRAYIGQLPFLAVGIEGIHPDVGMLRVDGKYSHTPPHRWMEDRPADEIAPDISTQVAVLDPPEQCVLVEFHGLMVAAIELISPGNKDRREEKEGIVSKCLTYLKKGVNLMIVDVHSHPKDFSIAVSVERELGVKSLPLPAPFAVSYRIEPVDTFIGGHFDAWRRLLVVGRPLPTLPLTLGPGVSVSVDLEATYTAAAELNYLT